MAGVAIGHIHIHFTWQVWHLMDLGGLWWRTGVSADAVDAAPLCVAGVELGDIHLHFAWKAWHYVTGLALGDLPSFHVAGVALGHIHIRFCGTYGTGRALVAHRVLS